jgi:hypothetical protein
MQTAEIPLGEWLPDGPTYQKPGLEDALNVVPTPGGYGPLAGLQATGATIDRAVRGARQFYTPAGNSIVACGADDALFTVRGGVATRTSGLPSIGENEAWDFCQFNTFVIATAANNPPQYLENVTSDDTFAALGGSPPEARRCARVGDFVMFGNITDAASRIQWSAINAPADDWTPSRLTQAGFLDLDPARGQVQKIAGGRYAIVFQTRGITRLAYVGPPTVWQAETISEDRGALAPFSTATVGYLTYFLAQDGFYVTNGTTIEPIGSRRINKWFFDSVEPTRVAEVQAAIDWQNKCVVWSFPTSERADADTLLFYAWEENRWSYAQVSTQWIVGAPVAGLTLEQVDALYPDLDAMPVSLDSAQFKARERVLACFTSDGTDVSYSLFLSTPIEATWETGEFQPAPGRRVFVSGVTPVLDSGDWDLTATLRLRDTQNTQTESATVATGYGGFAPVRGEGKHVAVRVTKPAGEWSGASAVQVQYRPGGTR